MTARKKQLRLASAAFLAGACLGQPAQARADVAKDYPSKPIRLVVGATAGSQTDTLARMAGQKMSESWGRPVVVDNRAGAGGTLAAAMVAKATADGHSLLFAGSFLAISAVLQPNLPYDPLKDFAGVTQLGFSTGALIVAPSLGVNRSRTSSRSPGPAGQDHLRLRRRGPSIPPEWRKIPVRGRNQGRERGIQGWRRNARRNPGRTHALLLLGP